IRLSVQVLHHDAAACAKSCPCPVEPILPGFAFTSKPSNCCPPTFPPQAEENPKSETRNPTPSPGPAASVQILVGFRFSAFLRASAFGFQIWHSPMLAQPHEYQHPRDR